MKKQPEHKTVRIGKLYSKLSGQDHLTHVEHYVPSKTSQKNHGCLFFVLDIHHPQKDSQKIFDTIVEATIKNYYKNLDDPLTSLEIALRYVNESLAEAAEQGNSHWIDNLNAVIAVVSNHDIHLTQTGTCEAFLIRNKIISHITEGLSDKNEDKHPLNTFVNISSGKMILGDRIIISTEQLFNNISLDRLRRLAVQHNPTTCVAEIARILAQENIRSIGTIMMEATTEEKLAKEVVKPQPEEVILQDKKNEGTKFSVITEQARNFFAQIGASINKITKKIAARSQPKTENQDNHNQRKPKKAPVIKHGKPTKTPRRLDTKTNLLQKINQKPGQKQYYIAGAIIILIIILGFSITYIRNRQNLNNKKNSVDNILTQADDLASQADNAMIVGDNNGAKSKYSEALELLASIESSPFFSEEITSLNNNIYSKLDGVDQISRLNTNEPLADLSSISEEKYHGLFRIDDNLYSFAHDIASINFTSGKITNITGFDINNFVDASLANNSTNLIFYHQGLMQKFDPSGNTLIDISTLDSAWQPAVSLATYYDNLYLLSPAANQIFKYSTLGGTSYSTASDYIVNAGALDLSNATSLAIDGAIYVLKSDGNIIKFIKGEASEYKLSGLPEPYSTLSNPNHIYTDEDSDFIYISDPNNKRILQFKKDDGSYIQQVVGDNLGDIDYFVVNEKINTIYLLADNKIYSVIIK
ncbi:MAG: hypothetical protein WC570_00790 [Patescibacteria group bacterium]